MKIPNYIVESIVKEISKLASVVRRTNGRIVMNGRCPICGDSKKKQSLKRFWVHEDDEWYSVSCYNCGLNTNFRSLLKDNYPEKFDSLKLLMFNNIRNGTAFKKFEKKAEVEVKRRPTNELNEFFRKFFAMNCFKLGVEHEDPKMDKIRKYAIKKMKERNISENHWKDFYFCNKGDYFWRVIIPYTDESKLFYYFTGRDIKPLKDGENPDDRLRYKTASFDDVELPDLRIYNLDHVNKKKVVFICEGLFDSMFVRNGIALGNANIRGRGADLIREKCSKRIWVMDSPWKDYTGYKRMCSLLQSGEKCFFMPQEHSDCKDLNDLAIKLGVEEIPIDIMKNNILSGPDGHLKLKVAMMGLWTEEEKKEKQLRYERYKKKMSAKKKNALGVEFNF